MLKLFVKNSKMNLPAGWIEQPTSSLRVTRSTTELRGRRGAALRNVYNDSMLKTVLDETCPTTTPDSRDVTYMLMSSLIVEAQ
jgi:hypothetical protein